MKSPNLSGLIALLVIISSFLNETAAQTYAQGLDFNDSSYALVPKKARLTRALDTVPSRVSLKDYAPYPKSQGEYLTCTAWACAYCARTMVDAIKNNWTNRDSITAKAYSPAFLFRLINPNNDLCSVPTDMEAALRMMKVKGCIYYTDLPSLCIPAISSDQLGKATNAKLKDFARLFDVNSSNNIKIQAVKKSLSEKKPVVIGMSCPPSFQHAYHDWQPLEDPKNNFGGHAMCVIGYDDSQFGGAFEIQNSWGENWGFEGYTWIRYNDFASFVKYGYEFITLPETKTEIADLSGSIKLVLSTGHEMPTGLHLSTRGLKVVSAGNTAEPLTVYQTAEAYSSGTRFNIYISNNEPAYVYAFSLGIDNEITKIFPPGDGISAALTYKKNDVVFPGENQYIEFDNTPGKDYVCVLYSKNELDINSIIARVTAQNGSFNEKVYKAVGDRMVDPANIKFTNDKIAFQGISKGKDIVAMMIELDHK